MDTQRRRLLSFNRLGDLDFWVVTCIQMHCININVECRFELCLKLCSDYLSVRIHSLRILHTKTVQAINRDAREKCMGTGIDYRVWRVEA